MKLPLLILFFYINYVTSNDKYALKSYPKKVKPFEGGKILINSGKYAPKSKSSNLLKLPGPQPVTNSNAKSALKYTVFQTVDNPRVYTGVPDSPYFPVDQTVDHKTRVKKVLPDYVWSSLTLQKKRRAKRAAEQNIGTQAITKSKTDTIISTTNKLPARPKATTVKSDAPDKKAISTTTHKVQESENKAVSKGPIQHEVKTETAKKETKSHRPRKDKPKGRSGKARNGSRSKSKPKGQDGKNGNSGKKNKVGKRHGKSKSKKSKSKKSSKNHPLRKPRSNDGVKKSKKSSKKQVRKQGNATDVRILPETRRLTGARQASIEQYPYVASILKDGEHWCSGALLNQRIVITTANCLWKSNRISRMEVRCGSSYTDHGGQLANIQEVMKHPRWGLRKNPDNDVALILLDRNIKFSDSCHGVDLPNRVMLPAFDDAWVVSFGAERRDGIYDVHQDGLQVYHTFLMSNESCNNVTMRFGVTVTDNFICFTQSGKTSPCTRDTGAPAVSDGVLWGLASWGIRKLCGTERFPSMFSYLASHSNMDFITDATRRLMSEKRIYQFLDRTFAPRIGKKNKTPGLEAERIG